MNLRNVLRTYALLRQLSNDESALLETLRGLSEGERELMVQELSPGAAVKKKVVKKPATTRQYDSCLRCGTTKRDSSHKDQASPDYHEFQSSKPKSQRAASLAEQIKSTGKPHLGEGPVCTICSHTEDYEDHAQPSPHYHPFAPPCSARSAAGRSSANSAENSSTASTEDETANVGVAAGGSGE